MNDDWIRDPKVLKVIYDLNGFLPGDEIEVQAGAQGVDEFMEEELNPGDVVLVHSVDRDPAYPINVVYLRRADQIGVGDWDDCLHISNIAAWRRPHEKT